jgi:hypothetical protein
VLRPLLQVVASLAVLAGPALVDLGPRLHAGHISLADPGFEPGVGCGTADRSVPEAGPPGDAELPPTKSDGSDRPRALPLAGVGLTPAGAGAKVDSPTSSTYSSNLHGGLLTDRWREPPRQAGPLHALPTPAVDDPPPSSIFHPPRPS